MALMQNRKALMAGGLGVLAILVVVGWKVIGAPRAPELPPAVKAWTPASMNPRRLGTDTWAFVYPSDVKGLPTAPVNEPHITLDFDRPVPMQALKLSSERKGTFKAWVMVPGDKGAGGPAEYLLVGEGTSDKVELVVPWRLARKGVASLKIAYKGSVPFETTSVLAPATFLPGTGKSYLVLLPQLAGESDNNDDPTRSPVMLLEDGRPMEAHAMHDDIRKLGGGRYSHWGETILFSTFDGTDPRKNGRKYTLAKPRPNEMWLQVAFGS